LFASATAAGVFTGIGSAIMPAIGFGFLAYELANWIF
jgi:hypothetical protein